MRSKYMSRRADGPFTEYLLQQVILTGGSDESVGGVDGGPWADRVGRRIVLGDELGFVASRRFASVAEASAAMDELAEAYDAE